MWKKIVIGIIALIAIVIALSLFLTKGLSEVADKQLAAIKQGDIKAAYAYTAKDFQTSVSLRDFERFIKQYPAMKNNKKISWNERSFNGSTGMLKGDLIAADGRVTPVVYHFVKENDTWKVLGIVFNKAGVQTAPLAEPTKGNETAASDKSQGEIYQVLVSDVQGPNGSVDKAKDVIPSAAPKIYFSVYVLNAKPGVEINTKLVRNDNGNIAGQSSTKIKKTGNIVSDFSFTNVDKTWPSGDYHIEVTTSNQQTKTVDFKIE